MEPQEALRVAAKRPTNCLPGDREEDGEADSICGMNHRYWGLERGGREALEMQIGG
jgi:hypothetical protein